MIRRWGVVLGLAAALVAATAPGAPAIPVVEDQAAVTEIAAPACRFEYTLAAGTTAPQMTAALTCSGVRDGRVLVELFEVTRFDTVPTAPAPCAGAADGPAAVVRLACAGAEAAALGDVFQGRFQFVVRTPGPLGGGAYPEGCVATANDTLTCEHTLLRAWPPL